MEVGLGQRAGPFRLSGWKIWWLRLPVTHLIHVHNILWQLNIGELGLLSHFILYKSFLLIVCKFKFQSFYILFNIIKEKQILVLKNKIKIYRNVTV